MSTYKAIIRSQALDFLYVSQVRNKYHNKKKLLVYFPICKIGYTYIFPYEKNKQRFRCLYIRGVFSINMNSPKAKDYILSWKKNVLTVYESITEWQKNNNLTYHLCLEIVCYILSGQQFFFYSLNFFELRNIRKCEISWTEIPGCVAGVGPSSGGIGRWQGSRASCIVFCKQNSE